jgi:hypothetical protein
VPPIDTSFDKVAPEVCSSCAKAGVLFRIADQLDVRTSLEAELGIKAVGVHANASHLQQ